MYVLNHSIFVLHVNIKLAEIPIIAYAKSIKLTQKSKQEIRFSTGTTTESSETVLDCVFGSAPKLEFSSTMSDDSGKTSVSMSSNDVSLSAPSDADIPAEILQLVKQEYEKIK